jgi:hypothetical protein
MANTLGCNECIVLRTHAVTNGMLSIVHQSCRNECHAFICCVRPPQRMECLQLFTKAAVPNAMLLFVAHAHRNEWNAFNLPLELPQRMRS